MTLSPAGWFGFSPCRLDQPLGTDGELPRLVVGEIFADTAGSNAGRVWVLRLNATGSVVHTQAIANGVGGMAPATLSSFDFLGVSASTDSGDIDGDGLNDVVAGARGTNAGGAGFGAVYVLYMQADDTARNVVRISRASGEGWDNLPVSLVGLGQGIAGIPPRSGTNPVDMVVSTFTDTKAVVLFRLAANGSVLGVPEVIADGREGVASGSISGSGGFGDAVYSMGDLDGDGVYEISVGDNGDNEAGSNAGAVYLFFLNAGSEADAVKSLMKIMPTTGGLDGVAAGD